MASDRSARGSARATSCRTFTRARPTGRDQEGSRFHAIAQPQISLPVLRETVSEGRGCVSLRLSLYSRFPFAWRRASSVSGPRVAPRKSRCFAANENAGLPQRPLGPPKMARQTSWRVGSQATPIAFIRCFVSNRTVHPQEAIAWTQNGSIQRHGDRVARSHLVSFRFGMSLLRLLLLFARIKID